MDKIERKSLLYRTGVEYGDFTINHVFCCAHGCKYPCYAFNLQKRFGKVKTYEDWIKPKIVSNALELLDKEIPKYKNEIKYVQLCFMTDPFMEGYSEVGELSIKIIDRLNKDNIPAMVLTKGRLPKELDSTSKINQYGITLVSLDEKFREEYEPYAATYENRINALKYLHDRGYKTWVSIEPYPTPNICKQDLMEILREIDFVDYIVFGRLNYNKKVSDYKGYKKFFNDSAKTVIDFCETNKIRYHIKDGTITE